MSGGLRAQISPTAARDRHLDVLRKAISTLQRKAEINPWRLKSSYCRIQILEVRWLECTVWLPGLYQVNRCAQKWYEEVLRQARSLLMAVPLAYA